MPLESLYQRALNESSDASEASSITLAYNASHSQKNLALRDTESVLDDEPLEDGSGATLVVGRPSELDVDIDAKTKVRIVDTMALLFAAQMHEWINDAKKKDTLVRKAVEITSVDMLRTVTDVLTEISGWEKHVRLVIKAHTEEVKTALTSSVSPGLRALPLIAPPAKHTTHYVQKPTLSPTGNPISLWEEKHERPPRYDRSKKGAFLDRLQDVETYLKDNVARSETQDYQTQHYLHGTLLIQHKILLLQEEENFLSTQVAELASGAMTEQKTIIQKKIDGLVRVQWQHVGELTVRTKLMHLRKELIRMRTGERTQPKNIILEGDPAKLSPANQKIVSDLLLQFGGETPLLSIRMPKEKAPVEPVQEEAVHEEERNPFSFIPEEPLADKMRKEEGKGLVSKIMGWFTGKKKK